MAKVRHVHEEYPEHDWKLDEDNEIDLWAWESGYHAGPACIRCGKCPCCYCETKEEWNKGPCIIDEYVCPKCGYNTIMLFGKKYSFCPMCGENLDWSEYDANH